MPPMIRPLVLLLLLATPASAQEKPTFGRAVDEAAPRPPGMRLVWSDEFDRGTMPDPAKWSYDTERNREGWYNHEAEYYAAARPENVRVAGGDLVIEARHDMASLPHPADYGGQAYSSARILTRGHASWTYGFVEVRAKLACGRGLWPAIWMLPETGGWPDGGELDIMEMVGHQPGIVHGTVHTRATEDGHLVSGWQANVPDACTAFHRYQMNWTPDRITFGVDDRAYYALDRNGSTDRAVWPFDRPEYLILNVAVGGDWGGQQGIDDAAFPSAMTVDYARVWQR